MQTELFTPGINKMFQSLKPATISAYNVVRNIDKTELDGLKT